MDKSPEEVEKERLLLMVECLKRLNRSEDFKVFKEEVVNPTLAALETELVSDKADEMSEVTLRAKLKYLNSLKWFFDRMFNQL